MRKPAVRHGNPTKTRGFVMAYSSTMHDDGKRIALSGDEATCRNCKGTFKIFGTGKGMSEKGQAVVVEGDLVLCPCKKNRVIVGSNPGIFINADSGDGKTISAKTVAASAHLPASPSVDESRFARRIFVWDSTNQDRLRAASQHPHPFLGSEARPETLVGNVTLADYKIAHWTSTQTALDGEKQETLSISVNDRAATRQAIINRVRQAGMNFIERSNWAAHKNRSARMTSDWNYRKIAIHHAGRSFSCGPGALQLQEQEIQDLQMGKAVAPSDDIGYHYALDCYGNIFEGRDIRFKGENVHNYNTGVIGIVLLENLTAPRRECRWHCWG